MSDQKRPTPDFRALFESAPGLYLVLTPSLQIVAASDAYLRATLTEREAIVGRGVFDVFPDNPDDPSADGVSNLRLSLARVLQRKVPDTMAVQKYDIRKPESEGGGFEERHWKPVNYPVLGVDKKVAYILHSAEDVTEVVRLKQQGIEHEKLSEELRGEERFRKAFNANPEPITIVTISEGRYIDVNESYLRVTGYRREEVIGRTSTELGFWHRPEDRVELVAAIHAQGAIRDWEINFRTKTGEVRTCLDSAEMIEVAGQKCVITVFKDITEKKIMEKQLRQAQKMEAIGQLSGGIAHDFNNLLGVIIGYGEALEDELPSGGSLHRKCEQIVKAGQRAASLTRQLLAFSRQQVLEPKVLDLNAVVLDLEKMLRRLIGEDIDFKTELSSPLGRIKADQGQIEQVIMNLVVNARDAMPRGGRLTIETSNADVDEDYCRLHPQQKPGPHVLLAVSDTGIGMDAETQARIFDPFFTTKELGKGTGLGLSTVYGVVRQSGGHIWVYSELGRGTTFKIYLPRVAESLKEETQAPDLANSWRGTETILLVEDEDALRELTRSVLVENGYTVLDANGPAAALELARLHPLSIQLILTDVVMPGMDGRALVEKLMPMRPGLRVVYMSGYTGSTHRELLDPGAVLLPKPLTRAVLLRKVREALGTPVEVTTK
jgi:two-component system, cell cycle sensor histidine kinase and response regulator CckA